MAPALVRLFGAGINKKNHNVHHAHFRTDFFQTGVDLELAAWVGGPHHIGDRGENVFGFAFL